MADGPDLQAMIRAATPMKEGEARIFGMFKETVTVSNGVALQSAPGLFKADGKAQFAAPKRPGLIDKILKELNVNNNEIFAALKKCSDAAPVQSCTIDSIQGSVPRGSSSGIEIG